MDLVEAKEVLAAVEKTESRSALLQKALEILGAAGLYKSIIGHDAPAEGKEVAPAAFGENGADHSAPEGTGSPERPGVGAPEAGADGKIDAARAQARHADASGHEDIQTSAPEGVSSASLLKSLKDTDADGAIKEALDVSPVLARMTDVFAKGMEDLYTFVEGRFAEQDRLIKSLGQVEGLRIEAEQARDTEAAATVAVAEPLTKSLEVEQVAPPTPVTPGIALVGGRTQGGTAAAPQGLTKSMTTQGLMQAEADGLLNRSSFIALSGQIDTRGPEAIWEQLPEKVQALIQQTLGQ